MLGDPRFPVVNLASYEAIPLSEEEVNERRPFTRIPWTTMAFGVTGPYFNPSYPEWGRFPRLSGAPKER